MIILDSDALIDVLRKREPTFSFVSRLRDGGETLGTTSIHAAEILRGAHRNAAVLRAA